MNSNSRRAAIQFASCLSITTPSDDWRLFEVGFGSSDAFLQGHIPGAGHIDTNQLEQEHPVEQGF
jgi:3-mercaptopyruvate sulfurtransferase SseA